MKKASNAGPLPTADLAPTGRAKCIRCDESIAKGTVRVAVEREIDTGSFVTKGAGYLHPACVAGWVAEAWEAGLDDFVAHVRENSALESLPAFSGEGAAAAATASAAPKKDAAAKKEPPGFKSLTGKQVAALAAKLAKLRDSYKASDIMEKAGVDWGDRDGLRWHLAEHDLLPPTHPTLFSELPDSASRASVDALFAVLPRLAQGKHDYLLLPNWSQRADTLVRRAAELDPERVAGLLEGASKTLRLGIQLVRGRMGAALEADDRKAVLAGLAAIEATEYGLPRSFGADGSRLHVHGPDFTQPYQTALDLARHFGSEAEWTAALADAARRAKFSELKYVLPGLVTLPLGDLIATLSKAELHSGDQLDVALRELVERRADHPAELAAAAQEMDRDGSAQYLRNDLLVLAIARMTEVPADLEHEVNWSQFLSHIHPWGGSAIQRETYRRALTVLGRERTLALAEKILGQRFGQLAALPLLAVHFDDGLLRRLLTLPNLYFQGVQFGPLGAPVLPALFEAVEKETDAKRRGELEQGVRAVLGWFGHTGETFPAEHDRWLSCDSDGSYWPTEARGVFLDALRGMPEPRRIAALERLLEQTRQVERPFLGVSTVADLAFRERAARTLVSRFSQVLDNNTLDTGLRALGPEALAAFRPALLEGKPDPKLFDILARVFDAKAVQEIRETAKIVVETPLARLLRLAAENASGPTSRIYLIEIPGRDKAAPKPRAGTYSRSRGKGPSVDGKGEHIVTIDLEEVPELKGRFPGARAIALFAPDPRGGEDWDAATLVPVPPDVAAATDGRALSLVPVEVPTAIFDSRAALKDPALKEIRNLVFNRPGYVLGEPMYIQDDDGGSDDFVMQLAEQIGDINLGDSGSLYVFANYAFMQCF